MFNGTVLYIPRSQAIIHAARELERIGISTTKTCAPDVTHLLLPVPSFSNGDGYLAHLLAELPEDIIISGGNLTSPLTDGYRAVDFLQDPYYLAENAAITARCAIQMLQERAENLSQKQALIIGWGRIGKCLAEVMARLEAEITVAVRNPRDKAILEALGYKSMDIAKIVPYFCILRLPE